MWDFIADFFLDWLFYTPRQAQAPRAKRAGCATTIVFLILGLFMAYYLYRVFFKP